MPQKITRQIKTRYLQAGLKDIIHSDLYTNLFADPSEKSVQHIIEKHSAYNTEQLLKKLAIQFLKNAEEVEIADTKEAEEIKEKIHIISIYDIKGKEQICILPMLLFFVKNQDVCRACINYYIKQKSKDKSFIYTFRNETSFEETGFFRKNSDLFAASIEEKFSLLILSYTFLRDFDAFVNILSLYPADKPHPDNNILYHSNIYNVCKQFIPLIYDMLIDGRVLFGMWFSFIADTFYDMLPSEDIYHNYKAPIDDDLLEEIQSFESPEITYLTGKTSKHTSKYYNKFITVNACEWYENYCKNNNKPFNPTGNNFKRFIKSAEYTALINYNAENSLDKYIDLLNTYAKEKEVVIEKQIDNYKPQVDKLNAKLSEKDKIIKELNKKIAKLEHETDKVQTDTKPKEATNEEKEDTTPTPVPEKQLTVEEMAEKIKDYIFQLLALEKSTADALIKYLPNLTFEDADSPGKIKLNPTTDVFIVCTPHCPHKSYFKVKELCKGRDIKCLHVNSINAKKIVETLYTQLTK
ncbi:MAG: hypothetical protein K6D02_01835 [Lachnospiraceae bacterium]|nr:hypothetical protein [Lachnospiraceae bacterium]